MNDGLLERCSRALVTLESLGPRLDDLLVPRAVAPDGGERVAGSVPGSKPPLVIPIVDLKVEVEGCLRFWLGQVGAIPEGGGCDGPPPGSGHVPRGVGLPPWGHGRHAREDIAVLAARLRGSLTLMEQAPWAEEAALEVVDKAWLVSETVAPAVGEETVAPPASGTTRVVASWLRLLGVPLSRMQLRRLVEAGELAVSVQPDGSHHIALDDALTLARKVRDQPNFNLTHPMI